MRERLRSGEGAAYRVLNAGLLTCMALFGLEPFLGIGGVERSHLLAALAVVGLLASLDFMAARGRILCLAAALVCVCVRVAAAGLDDSLAFLRSFFPWLLGGGAVEERWRLGYGLLQTGIMAAVCYLLQILLEKAPPVKEGLGVMVFAALLLAMLRRWEMNHFGVAFLFCFLVTVCAERIQSRWEKARLGDGKRTHMLWLMPFFAMYLWLMAAMPVPEEPYDWGWAKNIYDKVRESLLVYTQNIKWGGRESFDMAFGGFSEDGTLQGDLQQEAKAVMTVRMHGGEARHLYLTGTVYDTFDGRGWSRTRQGFSGEGFFDTVETLYAVKRYNQRYWKDYLRELRLEIRYEDFHTGYVFAPLKLWEMSLQGEGSGYGWEGGNLCWEKKTGYGTEYGLRYFQMNLGQEEFHRFLEEAGRMHGDEAAQLQGTEKGGQPGDSQEMWGPEDALAEVAGECQRRNGTAFSREGLEAYHREVYNDYLSQVRLSRDMGAYLEGILGNAKTDLEKLRAIEKELSSLVYTLSPGGLPEWVRDEGDFLDYFLLEKRQGYCTYFATAFVLLARTQGIPARYVQGFCIPVGESGETKVYSHMAHAWPEAYMKGVGWIPFEPTPGYGTIRRSGWGLEQSAAGDALPVEDGGAGGAAADFEPEKEEIEDMEDEGQNEDAYAGRDGGDFWKLLGIALPLILACCGGLLATENALSRRRYRKKSPEERLRIEVFGNLEILAGLGISWREWETLEELRERAALAPGLAGGPDVKARLRFIEDYERVLYGREEAGENMLEEAVRAGEWLLGRLKETNKWAYVRCRIRRHFHEKRFYR